MGLGPPCVPQKISQRRKVLNLSVESHPKSTGSISGRPRPAGPGEKSIDILRRISERVPDEPPHSIWVIDACLFDRCRSSAR
jgi:hypothetical protein